MIRVLFLFRGFMKQRLKKQTKFSMVLQGEVQYSNESKFKTLNILIGIVHIVLLALFFAAKVWPLVIYNVFIVCMYFLANPILVSRKKFTTDFFVIYVEVIVHAALASLLIGWNANFMTYTIAEVSAAYYMCYTLPRIKNELLTASIVSFVIMITYFGTRILSMQFGALWTNAEDIPEGIMVVFGAFNSFLAFLITFIFSVLFAAELKFMKNQLTAQKDEIADYAITDSLTTLMNRAAFSAYEGILKEEIELEGGVYCMLMLDIDNFKKFNDTYGHDCGDEVLRKVAGVVKDDIRNVDHAFRWGGEEILVVVRAEKRVATSVAERIRSDIERLVLNYGGKQITITVTIGVAQWKPGEAVEEVIKIADERLYLGKTTGKNCVISGLAKTTEKNKSLSELKEGEDIAE